MENPIDLYEKVHTCIAVPAVSWHPTWWAVDILIINDKTNETLDFWTEIYDYSINGWSSISYDNISKKAYNNRLLLNKVMTESWFAPYSEEYWHFSYWDKEWAFYYDKEYAIYAQKSLSEIKLSEA
jgi:D-alanyl-D-alanine dipeptidase